MKVKKERFDIAKSAEQNFVVEYLLLKPAINCKKLQFKIIVLTSQG